jgi:hypothetical protein
LAASELVILPCPDGDFDVVLSAFAVMSARDAEKAAAELMRHDSPDAGVASQRQSLGPVRATFDALDAAGQESLADELKQAMARFNTATDGTVVVPAEYLEVVARREPATSR